jgi:hypothetical protein
MSSLAFIRGWRWHLNHLISKDRLPFTVAYVASVVFTLLAVLVIRNYILSLLCAVWQLVMVVSYLVSYLPGGQLGLSMLGRSMVRGASASLLPI